MKGKLVFYENECPLNVELGLGLVVECLPTIIKTLGLILSTAKFFKTYMFNYSI